MLHDETQQGALTEIEGPDEDACVWPVAGSGPDAAVVNLGPRESVATKLASISMTYRRAATLLAQSGRTCC